MNPDFYGTIPELSFRAVVIAHNWRAHADKRIHAINSNSFSDKYRKGVLRRLAVSKGKARRRVRLIADEIIRRREIEAAKICCMDILSV